MCDIEVAFATLYTRVVAHILCDRDGFGDNFNFCCFFFGRYLISMAAKFLIGASRSRDENARKRRGEGEEKEEERRKKKKRRRRRE